jgi:uncharacterized protein YbjT (DUF2867 family)
MDIIMGASGQVGSQIVKELLKNGADVRAIVHSKEKAAPLEDAGASCAVADAKDPASLARAFEGGTTLFVLTPEQGQTKDLMAETRAILQHYREAATAAKIGRILGLSSFGAQHAEGTGNLQMSHLLEHAFDGMDAEIAFLRPAYYFSNWLPGIMEAKKTGVLSGFFPDELSLPMVAPADVARFAAQLIGTPSWKQRVFEIEGPEHYTPKKVAAAAAEVFGRPVKPQQIPEANWPGQLQKMQFSPDSAKNFIEMTKAVIAGKARGESDSPTKGTTGLKDFLKIAGSTSDR